MQQPESGQNQTGNDSEIFWQGSPVLCHAASLAALLLNVHLIHFPLCVHTIPYDSSEDCLESLSSVLRRLYVKATGDLKGKIWRGL